MSQVHLFTSLNIDHIIQIIQIPMMPILMPIFQKQQRKGFTDLTTDQFDLHPEFWNYP